MERKRVLWVETCHFTRMKPNVLRETHSPSPCDVGVSPASPFTRKVHILFEKSMPLEFGRWPVGEVLVCKHKASSSNNQHPCKQRAVAVCTFSSSAQRPMSSSVSPRLKKISSEEWGKILRVDLWHMWARVSLPPTHTEKERKIKTDSMQFRQCFGTKDLQVYFE